MATWPHGGSLDSSDNIGTSTSASWLVTNPVASGVVWHRSWLLEASNVYVLHFSVVLFLSVSSSSTVKKAGLQVQLQVDTLEEISRQHGLSSKQICSLMDAVASNNWCKCLDEHSHFKVKRFSLYTLHNRSGPGFSIQRFKVICLSDHIFRRIILSDPRLFSKDSQDG